MTCPLCGDYVVEDYNYCIKCKEFVIPEQPAEPKCKSKKNTKDVCPECHSYIGGVENISCITCGKLF